MYAQWGYQITDCSNALVLISVDRFIIICFYLQLLIHFICEKLFALSYLKKMLICCCPNPTFDETSFKQLYLYCCVAYCFLFLVEFCHRLSYFLTINVCDYETNFTFSSFWRTLNICLLVVFGIRLFSERKLTVISRTEFCCYLLIVYFTSLTIIFGNQWHWPKLYFKPMFK